MSVDGKYARGCTIILTDTAKKKKQERINIGRQHDRWVELKEGLRIQIMLKCKHQCHFACSSEIWTCIINDAGRLAAHKKQRKCTFYALCFTFTAAERASGHFRVAPSLENLYVLFLFILCIWKGIVHPVLHLHFRCDNNLE